MVALIGDEATVKYYFPERDYVRFQPANAADGAHPGARQRLQADDAPRRRRRRLSGAFEAISSRVSQVTQVLTASSHA